MNPQDRENAEFLKWALSKMGCRWAGFRKPANQVMKRIRRRMNDLNLKNLHEYRRLLNKQTGEWKILESFMTVTISRFFRDRELWDVLAEHILPDLVSKGSPERISIWSAGCCNGEEPFSIAIAAVKAEVLENVFILASDRNRDVLKRARAGQYTASSLKEMTEKEIQIFFQWNEQKQLYSIDSKLKESVRFEFRDIARSLPDEMFDLIFCRNLVFTYFREDKQRAFLDGVHDRLKDGGFLITGRNEALPDTGYLTRQHQTIPVYQKKSSTGRD